MRGLFVMSIVAISAIWSSCSTDDCADKDRFGQKRKKTPKQQAACKAADQSATSQETATGGGTTNEGSSSGAGSVASGTDSIAPTALAFVRTPGQAQATNSIPVNFTVTFSEAINPTTFTSSDITNIGTSTGVNWMVTNSGDNKNFIISATTAGDGTLQPRIASGGVADIAGNLNASHLSSTSVVSYSTAALLVALEQASGQADPTNALPIIFTVVFSRAVNLGTFGFSDIANRGTATGITWNLSTADNITWQLTATSVVSAGTVEPFISANSVQDNFGNNNYVSTSADGIVTYQLGQ